MFEQSLYDTEPVATPLAEGDLFHKYEIKNWDLGPRLYKIFAITAACNILAILLVAQTSLLTTKTCDSPIVGRVCQVLDTVYVGALLFGTDREYVDAAYDKTDLGDYEITYVDASGETPPLSYPEGYFQIANPDEYQAMLAQQNEPLVMSELPPGIPMTTPSRGNSLIDTKPIVPKHNDDVIDGDLPTTIGGGSTASNGKKPTHGKPTGIGTGGTADIKVKPTPEPSPISSNAVEGVVINKRPLTDFADGIVTKWATKEVDLNSDFTLVLNGYINADGKLDRTKSKFDTAKTKGDPKMIDVGKAALEALGDSNYLSYLKLAGVDQITATLVQDDQQITVVISSVQKTPERANSVSSLVSGAILLGKVKVENPSDERTLLDGAKVSTDGKNFILNFAIPKPIAQEMINRKLKEAQAKKTQQSQPNSNALSKASDNTAKR